MGLRFAAGRLVFGTEWILKTKSVWPAALLLLATACASRGSLNSDSRPILVIAHRGASGYLPEHTLEAYELAIDQGAHYIEPDLVMTRDGFLIARHENEITQTTDVESKFPRCRTKKQVDGKTIEGCFAEDLSLNEIQTLRAKQRVASRDQSKNGLFKIPTFDEILTLVRKKSEKMGRRIGVYVETKHSSYFRSLGESMEEPLIRSLHAAGFSTVDSPVFIQSFETANLKKLKTMTQLKLVQLIELPGSKPYDFVLSGDRRTYKDLMTPEGLREIRTYASAIGPYKRLIIPEGKDKKLGDPTDLVKNAHAQDLDVHTWTFRNEPEAVHADYQGNAHEEYRAFSRAGVDGVFTDFPDTAIESLGLIR